MSKGLIAVWFPVAALLMLVLLWSCDAPDETTSPGPVAEGVKEGAQQAPVEAREAPPKVIAEPETPPTAVVPASKANPDDAAIRHLLERVKQSVWRCSTWRQKGERPLSCWP